MEGDNNRKVMVCRRVVPLSEKQENGKPGFEAVVLGIAVVRNGDDLTAVYCAPFQPDGTLESLSSQSVLSNWQDELQSQPVSSANYLTSVSISNQRPFSYLKFSASENDKASTVPKRAVCVHRVFQELSLQIFGPSLWAEKYAALPSSQPADQAVARPLLTRSVSAPKAPPEEYGAATARPGDEVAQTLLVTQVRVIDPHTQSIVDEILKRLARTAPQIVSSTSKSCSLELARAHIIASPDVQAFALPGGEVFICGGLLDTLDDSSQLAAVLAHELSHLTCEDAGHMLHERAKARRQAEVTSEVLTYAMVGVGPFLGPGGSLASTAIHGGITGFSDSVSRLYAEAAMEGYSEDAELRADAFAHLGQVVAGRSEHLGRAEHGRKGRAAKCRQLHPDGRDAGAECLQPRRGAIQPRNELAVICEQLDERPAGSDTL